MTIKIEEVRAFIASAKEAKKEWEESVDSSWRELKKLNKFGRPFDNKIKKYPAWYNIFNIRKPLILARIGIPIAKDTTQDGNDNVGATAAVCKERLAINLAKAFPFFDVMCSARDDFLAGNVAQVRHYYEMTEVKERVKEYLQQEKVGQDTVLIDGAGKIIESDNVLEDDEGYYIEHDQTVDVDNERICIENVNYKNFLVDPDIRRFRQSKRLAFGYDYSPREFKEIFGDDALFNVLKTQVDKEDTEKRRIIKVWEYWDEYEKETLYLTDESEDFITPLKSSEEYKETSDDELLEGETSNGIYDLEGFVPCPEPLVTNQDTLHFWPVTEYYQLREILDNIHILFARKSAVIKAIRPRLLYDKNVDGLEEALQEGYDADIFGVTNLAQSLAGSGGTLDSAVQYIPIQILVESLAQIEQQFQAQLMELMKLTGTSDLIQGYITDPTQRTFGERQMLEKYALNQIAEAQRLMQEFVRNNYELMCEMALKNFKQASLDMYIMPQTLPQEHQQRYMAAMGMLKEDNKRFRIDLQTDSTLALNEDYEKKENIEFVNTITAALEKTAQVADSNPPLAIPEIHALKVLVQSYRKGKMFQEEISNSLDEIIQQLQQKKDPFDPAMAKLQIEEEKNKLNAQWREQKNQVDMYKVQTDAQLEQQKLQLAARDQQFQEQLASLQFQFQEVLQKVELQQHGMREQRLEEELAFHENRAEMPQVPAPPNIIVVPSPQAPQVTPQPIIVPPASQTIINAPQPQGNTSVIQPVQQVPVPVNPYGIP